MPQALPSFVELLDSLDLEEEENSQNYAHYSSSPSLVASSPSSSLSSQASPGKYLTSSESATQSVYPSPSIVISHPSPISDDLATSRRRSISNRYSPYAPSNPFARRRSLPGDLSSYPDHSQQPPDPSRASSASPPITGRRGSLGNSSHEQSTRLSTARIARSKADQPISAFVRRRHPYSFPAQPPEHRMANRRSVSPTEVLAPVTLPSLPPLPRISIGIDSPSPSFSDAPRLLSIQVLEHNSTSISEHLDHGPMTTSRTPEHPHHLPIIFTATKIKAVGRSPSR